MAKDDDKDKKKSKPKKTGKKTTKPATVKPEAKSKAKIDNSDKKPKNPWGSAGNVKTGGHNVKSGPWGNTPSMSNGSSNRPNGNGQNAPDVDEMIRRAQDNFKNVMPERFGGGAMFPLILLGLLAFWLISGFYIVNPGENAVIQRFGAWDRTKSEPGLGYHFPLPIETAKVINVEEVRKMNIGFIEALGRGGSARRDISEESLMLTSDRNIVDLDLVIQWNIKSAEDYLFEIYDQENTIKKVAESAIREVAGQTNMFPIITNQRQEVADRALDIIQKNLDEYNSGVNINNILIEKAEVHPDVQNAFQDVQSAKQDAEDVKNRAEAYREDILPKARGRAIQMLQEAEAYRDSAIARANGDAERFNAIYQSYLTGKDVTKERIYLEMMEDVLGNAQKIILDSEGNGQSVVPYLPLSNNALSTQK